MPGHNIKNKHKMTLKYAKKEASCLENKGFKEQQAVSLLSFLTAAHIFRKGCCRTCRPTTIPQKRKVLLPLAKAPVKR